ncbi:MAG TPA: hypothetical protein VMT16_07340, partial [Thermoanaerobaculia bacterium]|nr:hypothetical protein [Thermoanaerobaculia bacterium]
LMTHQDFGIFLTAILASYLALVDWPVVAEVQVAPGSRYRGFVRALAALDLDGTLRVAAASEPERALSLRAGRSRLHGVEALARLLLLLPATYFALALLLTGPRWVRWGGALGALVAFTPWRTLLRRVWELSPARRWLPSAPAAG